MNPTEIFLLLLVALCVVAYLAQRTGVANPIAFVAGGMVLGLLPGFRNFVFPPDILLLIFLPPLLTSAAYFTSLRDFKANKRPILQLALGLVVFTCVVTAYAIHWLEPRISIPLGFVLGAIISAPDAVAAVSLTKHTFLPKRIMTILEGESLVNDATGLVLYQFAVAAVVTGAFSLASASVHFLWMIGSGVFLGWGMGWCFMRIFPYIREMSVEILSTFLISYAAYIAAEEIHSSGVLAVVSLGLTVGWYAPSVFKPVFRIPANAIWNMVNFVLEGLVFLLIGLHFPGLLVRLQEYDAKTLGSLALAVPLVAALTRIIWVFVVGYGVRFLFPKIRSRDPYPEWQNMFIISWVGVRGVVSLATALAIPLTMEDGWPFPHRDLIIFLAFCVILFTLLVQGLTLPWLIRRLKLTYLYDATLLHEHWLAKKIAAETARERLEQLRREGAHQSAAFDRIASHYEDRVKSLGDGPNTPIHPHRSVVEEEHPLVQTENRIWKEVLEAERKSVIALRQGFKISDDVMHDMLRDIDLLFNRFASKT